MMRRQPTLMKIITFVTFAGFLAFLAVFIGAKNESSPATKAQSPERAAQKLKKNIGRQSQNSDESSSTANSRSMTNAQIAPRQDEITQKIIEEYEYHALATPNDPYATSAWSLTNMQLPSAWNTAIGNGVVVAVIDSGFALNHEDLVNQWQTNNGETGTTKLGDTCWSGVAADKQTNNCDDDNNGYVDDYRGWDFVGVNNNPMAGETTPSGAGVTHGTETAGLVGMTGNNGKGSATASWQTKIMPLQALSDSGSGYTSSVVAAIYYAVDNGVKVINMSLGGSANDPALQTAIDYAYQHDVVVVAAAGNCGTGTESGCNPAQPGEMSYPGLSNHVISVGATTSTNARASFSSYGEGLDVVAPGSGTIVSPMWSQANQTSLYTSSLFGTSFSSPYVASVVALIKSVRPSSTTDDITAIIDGTATKVAAMSGSVYTTEYGHGLVNAALALQVAVSLNTASSPPLLATTGTNRSEHRVDGASSLSTVCLSVAGRYCTVRATNGIGYDRYLPYMVVATNGQSAWGWNTAHLGGGWWELRAVQGNYFSATPYVYVVK